MNERTTTEKQPSLLSRFKKLLRSALVVESNSAPRVRAGGPGITRREFLRIFALSASELLFLSSCARLLSLPDEDANQTPVSLATAASSSEGTPQAAAALQEEQSPPEESPPSPQAEKVSSEVIGGLETYGHTQPLNQEEVSLFLASLNQDFENGQVDMDPRALYVTEFIRSSEYAHIHHSAGDATYQEFVNRHNLLLHDMLAAAHPSLSSGLITRRLVVIEDSVVVTGSFDPTWINHGLYDSDGVFGLWLTRPYDPSQSAFWDEVARIDWGRIHETAHSVLHLWDNYTLDSNFEVGATDHEPTRTAFQDIPVEARKYLPSLDRNDKRKSGLMSSGASISTTGEAKIIDPYEAWVLARRVEQDYVHNRQRVLEESFSRYPNVSPKKITLKIGDEFSDANFEMYRSNGYNPYDSKRFLDAKIFEGQVTNGEIAIDNPFGDISSPTVPDCQTVLFIKVTRRIGENDEVYWRYLDIGDISVCVPPQTDELETANMSFNLFHTLEDVRNLEWTINYE